MEAKTFTNNGGEKVSMNDSTGNKTPDSMKSAKSEKAWTGYGKDPGSYSKDAHATGISPKDWKNDAFKGSD